MRLLIGIFWVLIVSAMTSACSKDSSGGEQFRQSPDSCENDPYQYMSIQKHDGNEWSTISEKIVRLNPVCELMRSVLVSACGDFISTQAADWALPSIAGYIRETPNSEEKEICFNGAAVAAEEDFRLLVSSGDQKFDVPLDISWTPTNIPGLKRWYKADSFLPLENSTPVGNPEVSAWKDFSSSAFNGFTSDSTRYPILDLISFKQPTLQFCGSNGGCKGTELNTQLQIGNTFDDFSNGEFTLIVVAARGAKGQNYFLSDHTSKSNTGLFMGWISNTKFRVGFAGAKGKPHVTVKRPGFTTPPQMDIWLTSFQKGKGLELRLNNTILAIEPDIDEAPLASKSVPYIGTQRGSNKNSLFYLGEWIYFDRPLAEDELSDLHEYLSRKYL